MTRRIIDRVALRARILKALRPGPKSTGELSDELNERGQTIRECCKDLIEQKKIERTTKINPWASKQLLFCIDDRTVVTATTWPRCKKLRHAIRFFWPKIKAWQLAT